MATRTWKSGILALSVGLWACEQKDDTRAAEELLGAHAEKAQVPAVEAKKAFNPRLLRRFKPARTLIESDENPVTDAKVALGRMLYHEKRLSKAHDISCNSCHQLDKYGVDGRATSLGDKGQQGGRNAPTVFHAAGHFEQFWDGRAASIEAQALGPIMNPIEMAAPSEEHVLAVLGSIPEYVEAFKRAFPDQAQPLRFDNVGNAIGAFERTLTTRSRWDKYLEGDTGALTDAEVEGLKLFTNLGCMVCHTGEFLGGSMYEKVGTVEPWPNQEDLGRYEVTKKSGDKMMFKVPTLRNVAETAPYFHDGSAETLEQAVRMMGKHQLGLDLEAQEVAAIVAWLKSLTGEVSQQLAAVPALPESTARTPKPDAT